MTPLLPSTRQAATSSACSPSSSENTQFTAMESPQHRTITEQGADAVMGHARMPSEPKRDGANPMQGLTVASGTGQDSTMGGGRKRRSFLHPEKDRLVVHVPSASLARLT